jgi:ferredoxin
LVRSFAAASHVVNFLGEGKLRLDPFKPVHIGECDHCGECVAICPSSLQEVQEESPLP